ncbi:MAG TPA: arylsulfotransferase family protein [Solirubrobacteraceae bacterium]|nr:arylsulfotransferase family protein [Solirubrobacteraceae bacterium]
MRLHRVLRVGALLVVISSTATLVFASRRIAAEQAAYSAPSVGRCTPAVLNVSAVLPGTDVAVSPLPGTYTASPYTQISLLGAPASALSDIRVSGSLSGTHRGRLRGYSQGDGASFVPAKPFRTGEMVSVHGRVQIGARAHRFAYRFVVAREDSSLETAPPNPTGGRDPNEMQHFRSRPELRAPILAVTASSALSAPGDLFAAPYAGPGPSGPTIYEQSGNLVWFDPLPANTYATDLQVQQLEGKPVLTWWQGYIPPQGFGQGEEIIDNTSYQTIARVRAGNGFSADLHEFRITPNGTALLTVFDPIYCDLSSIGGPSGGAVTDSTYQEVDLHTGLVRREWTGLDHIALAESYSSPVGSSAGWPYDYFHLNSIDPLANGRTLISARNTSALYTLYTPTGQVTTRIGGRNSSVKLAAGAATAYQHDATTLPSGAITVFDNGGVPKVHEQSRALILSIDPATGSDSVVAQYRHSAPPLLAGSQGNVQSLEDGNLFIGWGSQPYLSEFSAGGQLLFDAHMHGSYQSYRAFRFPWTGTPNAAPAIAAASASAAVTVYASWNGDTRTASWRVLGGPSAGQLAPVASSPRTGFETAITTPAPERYVAVQALDAAGDVLGTSRTIAG